MAFADDMKKIVTKVRAREAALYRNSVTHAFASITVGSPITGAPGQPVDKGELLASYDLIPLGPRTTTIRSDAPHAEIIENNRRGAKLRSKVGGFHSIKMTRIGWRRIVAYELKAMGGGTGLTASATTGRRRGSGGQFIGNSPELRIG